MYSHFVKIEDASVKIKDVSTYLHGQLLGLVDGLARGLDLLSRDLCPCYRFVGCDSVTLCGVKINVKMSVFYETLKTMQKER